MAEGSGVDRRGLFVAGLSLGAAIVATAWVFARTGADAAQAMRYLPAKSHLIALGAFALELAARGARVFLVARALGLSLTPGRSIRAQLAGDAAGALTPSRLGADPAKVAVLRGGGVGMGPAGALLLAEMGAEATALLMAAFVVALGPWGDLWVALGLGGYAVVVSAAGVGAFVISRRGDGDPPWLWQRFGLGVARWRSLQGVTREFRLHTARLRKVKAPWIVGILAMTVLHIAARLAVLPALVIPLGGGTLSDVAVPDLILRPFFVLYATALLPPPGGGGGVELAFATLLGEVLAGPTLAATLIWWRIYTFYLSAFLGGVLLVAPHIAAFSRSLARRLRGKPEPSVDIKPSQERSGCVAGNGGRP